LRAKIKWPWAAQETPLRQYPRYETESTKARQSATKQAPLTLSASTTPAKSTTTVIWVIPSPSVSLVPGCLLTWLAAGDLSFPIRRPLKFPQKPDSHLLSFSAYLPVL